MDLARLWPQIMVGPPEAHCKIQVRYFRSAASVGMARSLWQHRFRHLKLGTARLANIGCQERLKCWPEDLYEAALSVALDLIVMVLAATATGRGAIVWGCGLRARRNLCDGADNDDATLVDPSKPGRGDSRAALAGEPLGW